MRRLGFRGVLLVLFGPIVWAAHLLVVYATHASFCAAAGRSAHAHWQPPVLLVLAGTAAIALLLVAMPVCWPRRFARSLVDTPPPEEARFVLSLMRWLAGLSFIAVAASALAMVIVPACTHGRLREGQRAMAGEPMALTPGAWSAAKRSSSCVRCLRSQPRSREETTQNSVVARKQCS